MIASGILAGETSGAWAPSPLTAERVDMMTVIVKKSCGWVNEPVL